MRIKLVNIQRYRKSHPGDLGGFPSGARRLIDKEVLIWSDEHRAWWRPDAAGYTTEPSRAGVYVFQDAFRRTSHCGPEKKIAYVLADGVRGFVGLTRAPFRGVAP